MKNSYSYSYSYSFLAFDKIKEDIRGVAGIKNVLKFFVVAVFIGSQAKFSEVMRQVNKQH